MNRSHLWPSLRGPLMLAALCGLMLVMIVALSAGQARASRAIQATIISGDISADTTWTSAGSPYRVSVPISVTSAATLTIEPGVEVQFATGAGMRVEGGLNAQGTQARQVRMVGEGGATWLGLTVVQPSGNIHLQSVTIRDAIAGLGIHQQALAPAKTVGRVDVLDSLFDGNGIGVTADYSSLTNAPRLTLRNSLFVSNTIGLQIDGLPTGNIKPKFNHNSFVGNGIGVLALNIVGNGVKMQQHWWGNASGPVPGDPAACAAPPTPGASARDLICGNVDYAHWSKVPAGRVLLRAGQGTVIESALGAAALSDDDLTPTSIMTLTVPAGALVQPVDLLASGRDLPSVPPGQPTQLGLEVTAAANGQEIHQFANGQRLTLEIHYTAADLTGADPQKLVLYYYDEVSGAWSFAGITTLPDPSNQRVIAQLEHLSRMRITSVNLQTTWLPMVGR